MPRASICVGIDHGTTNSGIAVMEPAGPRVIKPNGVDSVMPSAVYYYKTGRQLVGSPAYNAMMVNEDNEGIGHIGYKLRIGQDDTYRAGDGQKPQTAPGLGAIVMGELLRAYVEDCQLDGGGPKMCVITVPAVFDQSACEGTREAARLAGLLHYPLLQEPIAASLAYGFSAEDDRAQWIVFDIGGGTLDISLMLVRDGQMIVPQEGHAGDDRLGGRKFDREILDYVVAQLNETYSLEGFIEDPRHEAARNRLLLAIEKAKIELSKRESSIVELEYPLCRDASGKDVLVEVPLTRKQYESMIAQDVDKAIHVCKLMMERNRLAASDIDRIILIGGPSRTPYLQQQLKEQLGIPLEASIDPMTAVAQGAAVYAATVEVPPEIASQVVVPVAAAGEHHIQLAYDRSSKLATYELAGRVYGPAVKDGGLTVEVSRTDGAWSSGRLPVSADDGTFACNLSLIEGTRPQLSQFVTTVYNDTGAEVACLDEPEIWYPYVDTDGAIKATSSLRVELRGNRTAVLIRQGADLPARGHGQFVTRKAIRKGSSEDVLNIPVEETVTNLYGNEDEHADCNFPAGTLTIEGDDARVTTDLPEGAAIELTLYQDESRVIRAVAFVPLLDEEFEAEFTKESFTITADQISERLDELKLALDEIRTLHRRKPEDHIELGLDIIDRLQTVESIEKDLARARGGEPDARYSAYKHMLELAGTINEMKRSQRPKRIQDGFEDLDDLVSDDQRERFDALKRESAAADPDDDAAMNRIEEGLEDIQDDVRMQPLRELLIDLISLSGQRATPQQHLLFNEADELYMRLEKKGGGKALTDSDIRELKHMHQKLADAYPDLYALRDKKLAELRAEGQDPADFHRSDVDSL